LNGLNLISFDANRHATSISNTLSGSLTGASGSMNPTSNPTRPDRVGVRTGVFALGSPRVIEFGLKVTF